MIVRRVGVLSLARIVGAVDFAIGLIVGLIASAASLFGAFTGMMDGHGHALWGFAFGVGAVFVLPLFYGFLGFVGGAAAGLVYNLASSVLGGLELEIEPAAENPAE